MSSEEMAQRRVRRGYWLRRARLKSGLSLQWVAEQLGQKSASSVSLWERALRDPKTEQMVPGIGDEARWFEAGADVQAVLVVRTPRYGMVVAVNTVDRDRDVAAAVARAALASLR